MKTTLKVYHRKKAEGGVFAFIYNFVGNIYSSTWKKA